MPAFSYLALQTSIYATLIGDATLMGLVEGVYDRVPDNADFPYVTIGDMQGKDWSSKTFSGCQYTIEIHVYSREGGRTEAATIMGRIYTLLHGQALSVSGQTMILMQYISGDIALETDGWSYHGHIRFNTLLQAS